MFFNQNPIITTQNFRQMDLNTQNNWHCNDNRFNSHFRNEPFQNQTFRSFEQPIRPLLVEEKPIKLW